MVKKSKNIITEDRAIELARAECLRRGLPWIEPVQVDLSAGTFTVWTNADSLGANIVIVIDGNTGATRDVRHNVR